MSIPLEPRRDRRRATAGRHPRAVGASLLLAAALALGACSSGRSSSSTTSTTARPAPSSTTATPAVPGRVDWPTYHANPQRTGSVPGGPSPSTAVQRWASPAVDGKVYAEPLVVGGRVIVATENDSVYALDASTGSVVWRSALGSPVPGGSLPCGDIDPSGITSTPAVDVADGVVYVVGFFAPAQHELVALDLADGHVRFRRPIDPPGVDPRVEQQRGALLLANGFVYVPYGGLFGDCGDYHGFLLAARPDGTGAPLVYQVDAPRAAAIWSPPGPAANAAGDLFVATGNATGPTTGPQDDAVIRLTPQLQVADIFRPTNHEELSRGDIDLGSLTPALLGGGLALQSGKNGQGYVLDQEHLGGVGGQLFTAPVCTGGRGAFGGTAYEAPYVAVPCSNGLAVLRMSGSQFGVAWRSADFTAGPAVISGGTLWCLDLSTGTLHAYDLASGAPRFQATVGDVAHFATPAIGAGEVIVAGGGRVVAFG